MATTSPRDPGLPADRPMILEAMRRVGGKCQHLWQRLPLKGLGILSAALPMVAVVVSAALAFIGNQNRQRTEIAITRHFETIGRLDTLLTLLLNAETGLRGHLLTQREEFLEPFALAQRSLPEELAGLRSFIESEPGAEPRTQKLARLGRIKETVGQEMELLDQLLHTRPGPTGAAVGDELTAQFVRSKALMDGLRTQLREMENEERRMLGERLEEIRRVRRRDYLAIAVTLLLGLSTRAVVLWMFNRQVVQRVERLTANLRELPASQALPHPASGRHDAIGELEAEVQRAHARIHGSPVMTGGSSGE